MQIPMGMPTVLLPVDGRLLHSAVPRIAAQMLI